MCAECDSVWLPADDDRWRAYRADDPLDEHDPPAIAFYCPRCASSEFDEVPKAPVK
jgi:hypothetical protein